MYEWDADFFGLIFYLINSLFKNNIDLVKNFKNLILSLIGTAIFKFCYSIRRNFKLHHEMETKKAQRRNVNPEITQYIHC